MPSGTSAAVNAKLREWIARARELEAAPADAGRESAGLAPEVAEVLGSEGFRRGA